MNVGVFLTVYLGFKEQLNTMFSSIPDEKKFQTVCCSATYTDKVRINLLKWYLNEMNM